MAPPHGRRLPNIEIWGGIECTVARVGERYVDQVRLSGHHDRAADIAAIASLGITALRYPVLWERIVPDGDLRHADWSWTDERLHLLREACVKPVVTLLHHGSGPPHTSLMDPQFAKQFACFAREVARRYPWLEYFTPVNEPLTTARFCGLYGVWYPHARDARAFLAALRNQVTATAAAMRVIRDIAPNAKLVQTEDLGYVSGTPELREQIDFENERRFASYDLLCGRVDVDSAFFRWAAAHGFSLRRADLDAMYSPPDILGLNYYVTGERFLDHRIDAYPGVAAAGNGRMRYVDVEAVRVQRQALRGICVLAREVWERYRLPVAITESHLGDRFDEQLRWLQECYNEVQALAQYGADVRAFTVWSLLGAYDWDSLLTQCNGYYESGAFDVGTGDIVETPVAQWIREVCATRTCDHAAFTKPGWWRRPERVLYPQELPTAS